jgi:hypothetical protein
MPAPIIGLPLPRATEAYAEPEKWDQWILAERGHGPEWARVFRIGGNDAQRLWNVIADAILDAPISAIRDGSPHGVGCQVRVALTLTDRTARVLTIWHYASMTDAPRLVTAYPTP